MTAYISSLTSTWDGVFSAFCAWAIKDCYGAFVVLRPPKSCPSTSLFGLHTG